MRSFTALAEAARARLPEHVVGYFVGPTAEEHSVDVRGWSALRFRPRILTDTTGLTLGTTVLGTPVRSPLLIAPMAQQRAADPEGERATGRAARRLGTLLCLSTNTGVPFADVAATGVPWWFQLYVLPDRAATADIVATAVASGARAIVLTADLPVTDPTRPEVEPRSWPDMHDMYLNLGPYRDRTPLLNIGGARNLTPDTIGWLADLSGLPVVVKGVLRGDDARRCVDAGAAGLVVSSHGGRRLAQSVSTAAALPEVVDAVAGRAEVYVDSGLRTAEHAAAALCLGARAVFLGRPVLWALAAGGEELVVEVLTDWASELAVVLRQLGAASLDDVGRDLVVAPTAESISGVDAILTQPSGSDLPEP